MDKHYSKAKTKNTFEKLKKNSKIVNKHIEHDLHIY